MNNKFKVSVVIPVMNEEGNVGLIADKLLENLKPYHSFEILFVDDGSTDNTLEQLKMLNKTNSQIKYLSFSRNFGHQNALKAGLENADGDCVISMDGDLQHPPELIPQMIEKWQEGYDIVYTIRKEDPKIGYFKRKTSQMFYSLINSLSDIKLKNGCADFRLLDRSIVEVLRTFQENALFYRGIISWLGFKQYGIEYMPKERLLGKTKYSVRKMFGFAITGITSFSIKPLRFSAKIGIVIAFLSFLYGLYAIYIRLFTDSTIEGWTSLLIVMSFIGGIQLIMLGILGEYLGKLFIAQKRRPSYIIKARSNENQ